MAHCRVCTIKRLNNSIKEMSLNSSLRIEKTECGPNDTGLDK